jgi:hypothetical protein
LGEYRKEDIAELYGFSLETRAQTAATRLQADAETSHETARRVTHTLHLIERDDRQCHSGETPSRRQN